MTELTAATWRKSSRSGEGNCVEVASASWRKSSRSGQGDCVEVAGDLGGVIGVRDSKEPDGPVLTFTPPAWRTFLTALPRADGAGNS
ncbi:DUF397 domain-containing protein [Plantactinospora endophytica]|uniref:Toxin n=1 Tax=Plantactinospora endophytica TaxID=673535 RepID=A0ABQ4E8B2_9ACTN|nr:DUF397 domain-containing protein [Plantactinospora endophytica]GIG90967.1 toxin [Plantactinospora endophytica]